MGKGPGPNETSHLFYLDIGVAFPLAVDAAAVLLAMEVEWLGQVAAV